MILALVGAAESAALSMASRPRNRSESVHQGAWNAAGRVQFGLHAQRRDFNAGRERRCAVGLAEGAALHSCRITGALEARRGPAAAYAEPARMAQLGACTNDEPPLKDEPCVVLGDKASRRKPRAICSTIGTSLRASMLAGDSKFTERPKRTENLILRAISGIPTDAGSIAGSMNQRIGGTRPKRNPKSRL